MTVTIDLPSAAPDGFRGIVIAGTSVLAVTLGSLLVWGSSVTLTSAYFAPGTVAVAGKRKSVQHPEGGVARAINVADGMHVEEGEVLLLLDDTRPRGALVAAKRLLAIADATMARLLSERDNLPELVFPPELSLSQEQSTKDAISDQRRLFLARRRALADRQASLSNQVARAQLAAGGLDEQLAAHEQRITLTDQELHAADTLARKGYGTTKRVLELKRALAELAVERASIMMRITERRQESEFNRLELFRTTSTFIEAVEAERINIERERVDLLDKIKIAEEQIERARIKAPVSGVIVAQTVHTVGGVIPAASELMAIVPEGEALVIEARIRPVDIDDVHAGMPTQVRLRSSGDMTKELMDGIVESVSADHVVDNLGGLYFGARIRINDERAVAAGGHRLRPGMEVEVTLLRHERTPLNYILEPIAVVFERAMRD